MTRLELLAPAKNYDYGVAAILSGADAVYIGAPKFGARYSAVNTLEEIKSLTSFAHKYGVKVFVTMNTVLFDDELQEAKAMTHALNEVGVDALIIQDMAYLTFGVDMPFHASTQAAALTPEKAFFYQQCGFERVILERAMSVDDMRAVRAVTTTELEAFVHGAICVSYSGQCYMGHVVSGRSGNRGVCSQPCRSTWNLLNGKGEILLKDKHLLSLLDLSLAGHLEYMIDAGITSFKIEGRLKDISYLKNSVAFYRSRLDEIIAKRGDLSRSSVGESVVLFDPQPIKTFSRGFTDYFAGGYSRAGLASFNTAKAVGEPVGRVVAMGKDYFTVKTELSFNNGDGICFIDKNENFGGTNINTSRRDKDVTYIYPNKMDGIGVGAMLFRNSDKSYIEEVTRSKMVRNIAADIEVEFREGVTLRATDVAGVTVTISCDDAKDMPKDGDRMRNTVIEQLSKSGDTIFRIESVKLNGEPLFMPVSLINRLRRELLDKLSDRRLELYHRNDSQTINHPTPYVDKLDYRANVTNRAADNFYRKCGFLIVDKGVELRDGKVFSGVEVMRTRYCLRREIGQCLKDGGHNEALFIENNGLRFELKFDCKRCGMSIIAL